MLLSSGAPACRRNSVNGRQCRSRYVIALPSPEFGSVFFSANCASSQRVQLVHHRPAVLLMKPQPLLRRQACARALRHRCHTPGPASPARNGIRRESSPRLPRTVFFHAPDSWPAGSPRPRATSERCATARRTSESADGSSACALLQHVGHVLAGMLAPGEVQRDLAALRRSKRCRW